MRFTIKTILVLVAALAMVIWGVLGIRETFSVWTGENIHCFSWLPASASNVSFTKTTTLLHTSWLPASTSNVSFTKTTTLLHTSSPRPRTNSLTGVRKRSMKLVHPSQSQHGKPGYLTTQNLVQQDEFDKMIAKFESETSATITNGLFYEKWRDDGGCSIYVFDCDTSIGYHEWLPR